MGLTFCKCIRIAKPFVRKEVRKKPNGCWRPVALPLSALAFTIGWGRRSFDMLKLSLPHPNFSTACLQPILQLAVSTVSNRSGNIYLFQSDKNLLLFARNSVGVC